MTSLAVKALPAITYPLWERRESGPYTYFTLWLNENASYGGSQDGAEYYVSLPEKGLRKCWNTAEVERICRDHYEQLQAMPCEPEDEDDARGIPHPDDLLRDYHSRVL